MTTNDKPVCYQIRCIDARIPGVWGSHDCAETRDLLAKSWDERGVKYETRDLYDRPQPAAPQVPEGYALVPVKHAKNLIELCLQNVGLGFPVSDELNKLTALLATPPAPEQPNPAGDDVGLSLSPEQCAEWLDANYRRHGEIEDKVCADTIRRLAAQPAQGEGEK